MSTEIKLGDLLGSEMVDQFENFDLTEVQKVLGSLASEEAFDLAHADWLQGRSLYGANLLVDYLSKLVKTVSYLEGKLNSTKNKVALEYKVGEGKITADMRRSASESDPKVEEVNMALAKARGAKTMLEKKYDILLKSHYYYKEIALAYKKGMISMGGNNGGVNSKDNEW